ncbi:hypothetical protein [Streptomyces roseolus]|uniref:hypothetical protein n=1 Tax=Streptomyces roseolus TaxID=67358 RepID=UPI0036A50E2B
MTTPFPRGAVEHRAELAFGSSLETDPATWTWTDVTASVLAQQITITHGEMNEGSTAAPGGMSLELDNPEGDFTPRYAMSPHYPNVVLGVPFRYSLRVPEAHLALDGTPTGHATTPDSAAISITGDLDVRAELDMDWYAAPPQALIGKWGPTAGTKSWVLRMSSRFLGLFWSPDGTTTSLFAQVQIGQVAPRTAVRATLDVSNGAGGWTVRFYHAPTLDGPWTQLGADVTGTGTTSIFDSTTPLQIAPYSPDSTPPRTPFKGSGYRFEVRNGINGAVVARPDFRQLADGTTAFTDGAGATWTLGGSATITNWVTRFSGTVDSWEPVWPLGDTTGAQPPEARVRITASGVLRRLRQNQKSLQSTLRRRIPAYSPLAYWPMEDGSEAREVSSALPGGSPLSTTGFTFAQDDTLGGSSPLPGIEAGGTLYGVPPRQFVDPASGIPEGSGWYLEFLYRVNGAPATDQELFSWRTSGTINIWQLLARNGVWTVRGLGNSGAIVAQTITVGPDLFEGWNRVRFQVRAPAVDQLEWTITWTNVGGAAGAFSGTAAELPGAITAIDTRFGTWTDLRLGHLSIFPTGQAAGSSIPYDLADHGFNNETAAARITRLCEEEGLDVRVLGLPAESARMGPQRPGELIALLEEAAAADGGIFGERRDGYGLQYRTRASLYNQRPRWQLNAKAEQIANPFQPVLDDQRVRNDSEVSRTGAGSARVTDPAAITTSGRYDEQITLNLYEGVQLSQTAAWRVHLGTWPEMRYPAVTTELALAPDRITSWTGLVQGDRITVDGLPRQHSPDQVNLLVRGFKDVITPTRWVTTAVCAPAGPWTVAGLPGTGETPGLADPTRADTAGSSLGTAVTEADTSLVLVTTAGPAWITTTQHPAEFPVDLNVGGERVRVTGIRPLIEDTFSRTVSNGWGTSNSGQQWSILQGPAADFDVTGGVGRQSHPTAGAFHAVTAPVLSPDVDLAVNFAVNAVPAGDFAYALLMARVASTATLYMARVRITAASGAMQLTLRKRIGNVETELAANLPGYSYVANASYRIRFSVQGSTLRARMWPASDIEPTAWQVSATDADLTTPDVVGIRTLTGSGITNLPLIFSFDNLISTPQVATVVRSVNGVIKNHPAGTDVRLWQPMITAL